MPTATLDEVTQIVKLQLGARQVRPDSRLLEDLNAESVDVANIVAALESKYAIQVKESEIARLVTVADLVDLVNRRQ
jgi:acyl carrier protein